MQRAVSVRNGVAPLLIRCKRSRVRVKLTRAGKRLVRKRERVKVWVNVSYGGTRLRLARVTLRR